MNAQLSKDDFLSGNDPMQAGIIMPSRPASVQLAPVAGKAVALDFEGGLLSSDAGLVLLKDVDAHLGLSRALSEVLKDPRDPRRIHFTGEDLIQQRVLTGCEFWQSSKPLVVEGENAHLCVQHIAEV